VPILSSSDTIGEVAGQKNSSISPTNIVASTSTI